MNAIDTAMKSEVRDRNMFERIDLQMIEASRSLLERPAIRKIGELGRVGDDKLLLALSAGIVVTGLLSRNGKLQRTGFRMLIAQLVAKVAKETGKNSVDRSRPSQQLEEGRYVAKAGNSKQSDLRSFPSGHAASALAVARAFSREYPTYTKPVLTAATVVGVLQIPRRANYPGDVAAGAGAGLFAEKLADGIVAGFHKVRATTRHRRRAAVQGAAATGT